jgi:hypothetical protein
MSICGNNSLNSPYNQKYFRKKFVEAIKIYLLFKNFSKNRAFVWDKVENMVETDRPKMEVKYRA